MSKKPNPTHVIRLSEDVLDAISELAYEGESPNKAIRRILKEQQDAIACLSAVIEYTLDGENHDWDQGNQLTFLNAWNEAEYDTLKEWDNVPDEVYWADPTYVKGSNNADS